MAKPTEQTAMALYLLTGLYERALAERKIKQAWVAITHAEAIVRRITEGV